MGKSYIIVGVHDGDGGDGDDSGGCVFHSQVILTANTGVPHAGTLPLKVT